MRDTHFAKQAIERLRSTRSMRRCARTHRHWSCGRRTIPNVQECFCRTPRCSRSDRSPGNEELELAASALVELGDLEHAARAEILLADSDWRVGQRDAAYAHLERAVQLVKDESSSPAKATVFSEVSRYHMLGDRFDDAIQIGRQALEMASELGLDEVRAHALNNIGSSRANCGDVDGIATSSEASRSRTRSARPRASAATTTCSQVT